VSAHRPAQPPTPAPDAFAVHKARVRDELEIAFIREGEGGYPLVLVHGYPETKRIWWRNIGPLVDAGYEVIVPDLRGYGDSDLSEADAYDLVHYSRDTHALVHDVLGHERCGLVAGDVGGMVIVDMAMRFEGFCERMVFFNTVPPIAIDQADVYEQRGLSMVALDDDWPTGDYRIRQGQHPDELLAELATPALRRQYVMDMYGHRRWASPGSFTQEDARFMAQPFEDAARLAASWAPYQLAYGRPMSEPPMVMQTVPIQALLLWGPDDNVSPPGFIERSEIAFPDRVGPVVLPQAGHFVQWERADLFNSLVAMFYRDLQK
jgi:pimeloyl-ACP methyl ester carboxylesterase